MKTPLAAALTALIISLVPVPFAMAEGGGAVAAVDSSLIERAKAHLNAWGQARSAEDADAVRAALLAISDTLEAASEDAWAAQCLERAGISWYRVQNIPEAQKVWARGLEVARRSGDKKRIGALLNANAVGVSAGGDDERAIELFKELIEVRREMEDPRGEGVAWGNLAYSLMARFRNPEAMEALQHSVNLSRQTGYEFGVCAGLQSIAGLLFKYGQVDAAVTMIDSAYAIADSIGDPRLLGTVAGNRGHFLHYAGRLDGAITSLERAVAINDEGGVVLGAARARINLANALNTAGRYDEALTELARAQAPIKASGNPADDIATDAVRGTALLLSGDTPGAIATLEASIARFDSLQGSLEDGVTRAELRKQEGEAFALLSVAYTRQSRTKEAWWLTERSLAAVLAEDIGAYSMDSDAVLAELQARLAAMNAIAIQYGTSADNVGIAFVVRADGLAVSELVLPRTIHRDISQAMRLMSAGAPDEQCQPLLARIADALLTPIAGDLAGSHERIVLIPGGFAGFAFEALPTTTGMLGLGYPITYAPSAAVFLSLGERAPVEGAFVAFADPSSNVPVEEHPVVAMRSGTTADVPLPEARAEVRAIAPPGAVVLAGNDATRKAFVDNAPAAAVLHFATHALADGSHPAGSALILAGKDGQLHPADIREAGLRADLVTLSGCNTAGGYTLVGEGVFGLTRAFLQAGARSVVSSWWDVEDAAARRFMELFYAELHDGAARDVAVMTARRVMADEGYPHRDRSAFMLTGATAEPVAVAAMGAKGNPIVYMFVIMGIVAALLGLGFLLTRGRRAAG